MPITAALVAILMWSSLAALTASLAGVPPLYLTGLCLVIGGAIALPRYGSWSFSAKALAVGVYGQLTYHVLYIFALRRAPAANANLIQYAWPLLTVLMAPLVSKAMRLQATHVVAALVAFAGGLLATFDEVELSIRWYAGYGFALLAALGWASYSIAQARSKSSSVVDVGPACPVSGLLALLGHCLGEPAASLTSHQWLLVVIPGLGPTGGAFYLWSYALRKGDARVIGVVSYATPVLFTMVCWRLPSVDQGRCLRSRRHW